MFEIFVDRHISVNVVLINVAINLLCIRVYRPCTLPDGGAQIS